MKQFRLSIHLFRRDLRLDDNTALEAALRLSEQVIPVFIFDNRQREHPYFGENSFRFLIESLLDLDQALRKQSGRLYLLSGSPVEVLDRLTQQWPVEALFVNRDYTPFSKARDESIETFCLEAGIRFQSYADALLTEPGWVLKEDGLPYTVFTPFHKKAVRFSVYEPVLLKRSNFFADEMSGDLGVAELISRKPNKLNEARFTGGRQEGLSLLQQLNRLVNYPVERNFPAIPATSCLSPHHKFGTVSIRETYHSVASIFGCDHSLITELYWRDFFTHIVYHFPRVLGSAFREKYNSIAWSHDAEHFDLWCQGKTGFPIVDAGMHELVRTGFMHNRVRMIVASFLTKDLHLDWRLGEQFFARHLTDYDPAVNNGNWQWAASTGCDAQPYFRIFNPWTQQRKFDPDGIYIRKWVPELQGFSTEIIHSLDKNRPKGLPYCTAIVNHSEAAKYLQWMFRQC